MAKKVDNSFDFLGLNPGESALDVNNIRAAIDRNINSDPVLFKAYHSEELFRPQLEQVQREREMERLRNVDVNSFNYLAKKAGYDEGYAANLFNRVQDISSLDTQEALSAYSELSKELADLSERATTSDFGGIDYLADFAEGAFEFGKKTRNIVHSIFGGDAKFTDPSEFLGKNKDDVMAQKALDEVFTPAEIYNYAKRVLDRQHKQISIKKFSQENGGADKILSLIESKNRDLKSMNGFDDLILPVLNNQFTTPGSEYYRGEGPDMTAQDVKEFQNYTKQLFTTDLTKRSSWGSYIGNDGIGYGKYDLEKEALNDYKSVLQDELFAVVDERRNLIDQNKIKKESKEDLAYQDKITRINSALDKLVAREKSIDQVYGVSVGDRSGFIRGTLGSAYMAARDFTTSIIPGFSGAEFDLETQLLRNAMYKPEVIKYDKYGNPVLSNQVFYETASGNKANWSGLFEAGGAMIGDMTPAIVTGSFVGRAVGAGLSLAATEAAEATFAARAVSSTAKAYDKVNRYGNLRLADRVSTFATIYGSTKPRIYEQEKKWGGDAEGRATYLAVAEAAAEAIGFPDVGMLKVTPYSRGLGAAAKTATGINLTRSQMAAAYLKGGAEFAKNAVKANLVESFEEEMSLLGETLVSKAYADEYAKVGREQTEFSAENILDTFVESFKGGLLYSGLMTGQNHYRATRKDALLDQAEYEAALNPELFKAKLKEIHQKNPAELSEKQLADGIVTIDNLSNTLKGLSQLENLRDLNTFFEDEESRRRLFTAARQRDVLRSIDFDSLTPEQQEEFTKAKLSGKIAKNATKEYNKVREQIANLVTQTQGKKLTPEETTQLIGLQAQALKLKEITNTIDLRKLNNSQMETLASMGIIQDKDFQFTQEDLDKMIAEVDTEILKTEKRAFEYASMTKAQKAEAIKKAYEKKIAEINEVEEPSVLMESLIQLKRDYEYLEKNVPNINPEILANKQALLDAFEQKFDSLTQRDESGNNVFEAKLRELDIDKAITDYNLSDLIKLSQKLLTNEEHVDADLASLLNQQANEAQAQIIENLNKLTGEQKIQVLAKLLDQTIKFNTITYFDKASFLQFLTSEFDEVDSRTGTSTRTTLTANVSDEEFEKVRAEVIRQRGLRKSASMATTGRVDNVSVPVDSQFQEDALRTTAKQASTASNQMDEDGISPRSVLEKQYSDSFLAGKTPAESVIALRNRIGQLLNEGSARANTLLTAFNNLLTTKDTVAFDSQLATLKTAIQSEAAALRSRDPNSRAAQALDGVVAELGLWQSTSKKLLALNPATDFAPFVNITTVTGTEVPPGPIPPVNLEEEEATLTPTQIKSKQEEINKLDEVQKRRRSRLLDLTSPIRSNGIELDSKDQINQDPAVKRRVAFINDLAATPNVQIKIFNKRQFLREFLAAKFPDKTSGQIEQDLKSIEAFFTQLPKTTVDNWLTLENQAEILAPITDLLGTEFFDKGQINYYIANRGSGLVTNPEVIMTAADSSGKILVKDGYPLELSFIADNNNGNNSKFANVPWRLSGRIQDESDGLTIKEGDVTETHKQTFATKKLVKDYLEKNDTSIMGPFEISEGVLVSKASTSTTIADLESNPQLQSASIRDFALPTQRGTLIAGKQFKYNVGRLYYDNNGNPVQLGNNKLDTDEILAIAEIIYSSEEVIDPSALDEALFDLINQINKDSKIVFFPVEPVMTVDGQFVYPQLLSPSKVGLNSKGERKYTKLSKEEFIQEMGNLYYKASAAYLEGGTKFNQKITRFTMKDGKPVTYKQSYLDFIKETHTIPVNSEGEIIPLVNKVVYPDASIFEDAKKTFKLAEDNKNQPPSKSSVSAKSSPTPPKNTKKNTDPTKTPVPNDVFNMIPFSELPAFLESLGLGALIPTYSEDTYNALLAELQSNPSFIPFVYTKDEQGVVRSDYVGKNPQASFLRAEITLNGKKYFVYFRPGSHTTGVNIGAVMTEGNVSFTTQIPQPTPAQTLPEVPSTTTNTKADIERRRQEELDEALSDVNKLRQADTVGKAQVAIVKATQQSSLPKAIENAGMIIGEDVTFQASADIIGVAKKLADAIEKIQQLQVNKINSKYDAELAALKTTPTTIAGKLENVRFQNRDYKVELVGQEDGTFQVANIFNPDGKSIPLNTATGISVMMLLDDEALGKKDTGFISVDELMNSANQTPQRPPAPSKPAPKNPTSTVFTEQESKEGQQNKDACAKGAGDIPSFKSINKDIPTGRRIRKK